MSVEPAAAEESSKRLFERERAWEALQACLKRCRSGAGRTLLVRGEAGIGKTALLRQWTAHARALEGAAIYSGGCEALFTPRPLGPIHDIALHLGPAIGSMVAEHKSAPELFAAIAGWLSVPAAALAAREPVQRVNVLVFEDVHWADHLTLDFLKYLGRRIHQWPALLVLSYRGDEVGALHPLTQVLGELPAANTDALDLQPLGFDALAKLSGFDADRTSELLAVTGGNPFFVTEVIAAAAMLGTAERAGVPPTVTAAVMARAQRISAAARAVLEVASLAPGSIELALLASFVGETAVQGVDECVQAGLLHLADRGLAFRHELARRAVEGTLSPMRRREMHARLYLQLQHRHDDLVDRMAYHAQRAHDSAAVLATAPQAAARAAALGAHREAASHYRVALDHAQHADDALRADLLERWAYECALTAATGDDVIEARLQAMQLRRRLGHTDKVGLNQRGLSSLYRSLGRLDEAARWLDAAIATLESIEPGPELAMAYSMRSAAYMLTNRWQLAESWGQRAIALATTHDAPGTRAHALNNIGSALADDGQMRGFAMLEQSLAIALEHNLHDHASRAYRNASEASVRNRLLAQAEALIEPGIRFARDHDMDLHVSGLVGALAQTRLMQGRLAEAQALSLQLLQNEGSASVPSRPAHTDLTVATVAATVAMLQDPFARSQSLQADWSDALASREPDRIVPLALGLAEAAWLRSETTACAEIVSSAVRACENLTLWDWGELACWHHRAGADPATLSSAAMAEPCSLEIAGHLDAAAQRWEQRGMPRHQAYALMLMTPPQRPDALAQAIVLFDRMGAVACSEFARRRARKLVTEGVKGIKTGPRSAARSNRFGLTARELQIASHLAHGRSNPEIAQRLSRSERTVEHHVATVLDKLGAKKRADVPGLLDGAGELQAVLALTAGEDRYPRR
jgi:DNA-binding CsgD family transcriptional regulator/tetratricopeptide (TPR) repeat protein